MIIVPTRLGVADIAALFYTAWTRPLAVEERSPELRIVDRQLELFDEADLPEKPAVLVSRCLLGVPCRYHGQTHVMGHRIGRPELIAKLERESRLVDVCPEVDAGMPTPRPRTDIVDGRWICDGEDVTDVFRKGAEIALALAQEHGCKQAYLLKDSPACDRDKGMTGKLLASHGITVIRS